MAEWEAAIKPLRHVIKKRTKRVEQGMKALRKGNKKSFAAGVRAIEKGYAGRRYDDLVAHMRHRFQKPGDIMLRKELKCFCDLRDARKAADKEGGETFADLTLPKLKTFYAGPK